MITSEEKMLKEIFYNIDYRHKYNNSHFYYNQFLKAIEKNNNREIEETEVYKLLISMLAEDKSKFKEKITVNTELYRARIVDITKTKCFSVDGDKLLGLNKYESKEPPLRTSKDGRSNIAGASYLYVAKDQYTAVAECKPLRESYISVARFETIKELNVFNLCNDDTTAELTEFKEKDYLVTRLVELIMRTFYCSVYDVETGYKASQYITELVRKHGYDGITFKSFISNGKNYTIFNSAESNIRFVNSEIVQVLAQHFDVVALNSGENVLNCNSYRLPSKEEILGFKNYLINGINFLFDTEDENNG